MPTNRKPNKQNNRPSKKTTIHDMNLTQHLRIPTLEVTDFFSATKSSQLKKNGPKKSYSRKQRCISVKLSGTEQAPLRYKDLLKQFKDLKLEEEKLNKTVPIVKSKSRSREKSKSKLKSKFSKQNKVCCTFSVRTDKVSQRSSLSKLGKTKKKLTPVEYYITEQQSSIPLVSISEADGKGEQIQVSDSDQDSQIREMTKLRVSMGPNHKLSLHKLKGDLMEISATIIQRAWRNYRTRSLVNNYTRVFNHLGIPAKSYEYVGSQHSEQHNQSSQIRLNQNQLYSQEKSETHISQLDNLTQQIQQPSEKSKQYKLGELKKWDEIIEMIEVLHNNDPAQIERMRDQLVDRSPQKLKQFHKKIKQLQQIQTHTCDKNQQIANLSARRTKKHYSSGSESPKEVEYDYDSQKYIEYLDSDIFPLEKPGQQTKELLVKKQKFGAFQKSSLISKQIPPQIGVEQPIQLTKSIEGEEKKISRSHSDKSLKRSLSGLEEPKAQFKQETQQFEFDQNMNLEILRKEFLQNVNELQNQYEHSNEILEKNLQRCMKLQSTEAALQETQYFQQDKSDSEKDIQHSIEGQKNIQIESLQENRSDQDDQSRSGELRGEKISDIIVDVLALEFIREINKNEGSARSLKLALINKKRKLRKATNIRKPGFQTNHNQVASFVQGLNLHLLKEQPKVFKNLQIATGPSALEMLHYMHQNSDDDYILNENQDESNVMVIPNYVFEQYWKIKQNQIVLQIPEETTANQQKYRQHFEYLKGFNKIFYRVLFDAYNQCLDFQRNYGQFGKPFPWKKTASFHHNKDIFSIQKGIDNAKKRMMETAKTYCGIIIEQEQMSSIGNNEEYLQHVQQDRLSRMLAQDLFESEQKWIFYDDEEAEILIELSLIIEKDILYEAAEELIF